jgi:hypothetical protein
MTFYGKDECVEILLEGLSVLGEFGELFCKFRLLFGSFFLVFRNYFGEHIEMGLSDNLALSQRGYQLVRARLGPRQLEEHTVCSDLLVEDEPNRLF